MGCFVGVAAGGRGGQACATTLVLLALIAYTARGEITFTYEDSCESASQYFDINGLECRSCPANSVLDGPTATAQSCKCETGFFLDTSTATNTFNFGTCVSCLAQGQVPSEDGSACLYCDPTTGPTDSTGRAMWLPAVVDATLGDCRCASAAVVSAVISETGASGGPLLLFNASQDANVAVKRCVPCPTGTYVESSDPDTCVACLHPKEVKADGTCRCKDAVVLGNTACSDGATQLDLLSSTLALNLQSAFQVTAPNIPGTGTFTTTSQVDTSAVFSDLLGPAATACWEEGDRESCNALANLCVLQMYDNTSPACKLYTKMVEERIVIQYHADEIRPQVGWSTTLPWLFYEGAAVTYTAATDVATRVAFSDAAAEGVHRLQFYASVSLLNGTWLGLTNFTRQFQLCGGLHSQQDDWTEFGTNYNNECTISLSDIVSEHPEPVFYDIYFEDARGPTKLYPVPVLVKNLLLDRVAVNDDGDEVTQNDVLVRRIFVADAVTGVPAAGGGTRFVRYASEVDVTIEITNSKSEIYPPRLSIRYANRSPSFENVVENPARYKVLYTQNIDNFWETWNILLIVDLVVCFFAWAFKMFCYQRRVQNPIVDFEYMGRAILEAVGVVSYGLFALLMGVSFYWFAFFKMQREVYTMLPVDSEVGDFKLILMVAVIMQSVSLLYQIWRQVKYDVFLIDWEKPRQTIEPGKEKLEHAPVAVWRTLFVANEWTELQILRVANFPLTLSFVVLLMVGLKLDGLGNVTPSMSALDSKYYDDTSVILRFATAAILMGGFTLLQVIWMWAIVHRYIKHPLDTFIDLISLCNVSVVLLEDRYSGFYLHGRSNMQHCDTTMEAINQELSKEQAPSRGLVSTSNRETIKDNQVFEMYLAPKVRADYDAKFLNQVTSDHMRQREQSSFGVGHFARPKTATTSTVEKARDVAKLFRDLINGLESKGADRVKEKFFWQRFLDVPPDMMDADRLGTLFVHDFDNSFGRLTFYGIERKLIIWNILVFTSIDMAVTNVGVAASATFFLQWAVNKMRLYQGDNNIARKSLVDAKFLV